MNIEKPDTKDPKDNPENNPKRKRNKIITAIAAIVVILLILTGIATTVLHSHNEQKGQGEPSEQGGQKQTCQNQQQQQFTDKQNTLDQTIQDAKDALATVNASLEPGEGTRLMHTDGFPLSDEGQTAIRDLDKAVDKAKQFKNAHTTLPGCPSKQDNADMDAAIKTLQDQTQSFITVRDAYRLTKATDEANALMGTAKSDLASAQKSESEQIAIVDANANMQSDNTVKTAYNTLKAIGNESHTLSTTTTYDEVMVSIEKAKAVEQKATDVTAAITPLKDAVNAYQVTKATDTSTNNNDPALSHS